MTAPVDHADLLLPSGTCLLHIGPYKTGSSSVQDALHAARGGLADHGVRYAGTTARARRAGWAVIGRTPPGHRPARLEEWTRLVREVHAAADARVCVSTEDFGRVRGPVIGRIVADLGADRVHVVTVVRRLDRLLASQWQQRVQSHDVVDFDTYVRSVLDDAQVDDPWHRAFWLSHDVGALLDRWSEVVGPDRITAVVADESDRGHLFRVFEGLLGLPAGTLTLAAASNPSLSANAVELHRRLNALAREQGWPSHVYAAMVGGMARHLKREGPGPGDVRAPRVPTWAAAHLARLSQDRVDAVLASGVRVVGDPDSLLTVEADDSRDEVTTLSVAAALAAVVGALTAYDGLRRDAEPRDAAPDPGPADPAAFAGRALAGELGRRAARRTRTLATTATRRAGVGR